jgi:hypothetical protein
MRKRLFLRDMHKSPFASVILVLLFWASSSLYATETAQQQSKDTVVIMDRNGKYTPFTFFKKPVFELRNNVLNIAVTDREGTMIQVNGIALASLKNTMLPASGFRTVYITPAATFTDDGISKNCLLDIRCESNKPGSAVSVGLKTTVKKGSKTYRIYATLSGTIPQPIYVETQKTSN